MEKNSIKGYAALTGKLESSVIDELNNRINVLSDKAKTAFNERCAENYARLSKLGKAQRINKLSSMIEDAAKEFPVKVKAEAKAKKARGTRQNNEFLNARKMGVVQLDKDGNFIAEHESIQAAHRAAKTIDGKIISDSSICYCCNHRKGFKTAGGYKWVFKSEYDSAQNVSAETAVNID